MARYHPPILAPRGFVSPALLRPPLVRQGGSTFTSQLVHPGEVLLLRMSSFSAVVQGLVYFLHDSCGFQSPKDPLSNRSWELSGEYNPLENEIFAGCDKFLGRRGLIHFKDPEEDLRWLSCYLAWGPVTPPLPSGTLPGGGYAVPVTVVRLLWSSMTVGQVGSPPHPAVTLGKVGRNKASPFFGSGRLPRQPLIPPDFYRNFSCCVCQRWKGGGERSGNVEEERGGLECRGLSSPPRFLLQFPLPPRGL